jgi:glycine/D-amino acid oxidase-like deaminating enzyme
MPILVQPIPTDRFPKNGVDVVIVGGGIIGVSAALTLAERGISVALLEKGEVAAEQSSRNWGWCRQQGRDPRELPLITESLKRWRLMDKRINGRTGFNQCGTLYLADSEKSLEKQSQWLKFAVPEMAKAAQAAGAAILTQTAVYGLETEAGKISGVVTEKGTIRTTSVLIAAGAWSRLFCRAHNLLLPQLKVRSSVLRTGSFNNGPTTSISAPDYSIRYRADGGYTVALGAKSKIYFDLTPDAFGLLPQFRKLAWMVRAHIAIRLNDRFSTEWQDNHQNLSNVLKANRVLDPKPLTAPLNKARRALVRDFPGLVNIPIQEQWAGMIDVTPDAVPVISGVDHSPGLFIATGFSGHGFGIGPAAGELAADLITNRHPLVDPSPFRFSRFNDGSEIDPIVGI